VAFDADDLPRARMAARRGFAAPPGSAERRQGRLFLALADMREGQLEQASDRLRQLSAESAADAPSFALEAHLRAAELTARGEPLAAADLDVASRLAAQAGQRALATYLRGQLILARGGDPAEAIRPLAEQEGPFLAEAVEALLGADPARLHRLPSGLLPWPRQAVLQGEGAAARARLAAVADDRLARLEPSALSRAALALAHLAEERGDREEAGRRYRQVIGAWGPADPAPASVLLARQRLGAR
jgi:hypothetical protein